MRTNRTLDRWPLPQVRESVVLVATVGGDGMLRMWSADSCAELLLEMSVTNQDVGLISLIVCNGNKVRACLKQSRNRSNDTCYVGIVSLF